MKKQFSADELALLAAIHTAPRDDTPRLVYADWLDEHGEPDYGEFIRLQCENARKNGDWSACEYAPRERSLVRRFGARWRGHRLPRSGYIDASHDISFCRFHRGLPEAHLDFWDDYMRADRTKAVQDKLGLHYQLNVTFNYAVANAFAWQKLPAPADVLLDPVFTLACRIHVRAFEIDGDNKDVPLTKNHAVSVTEALRTRKLIVVSFGTLTAPALTYLKRELAPHVPILTPATRQR